MNDELMHYGVKGMKWGVRKDRSSGSSGRTRKKKSAVSKAVSKAIKKGKAVVAANAKKKAEKAEQAKKTTKTSFGTKKQKKDQSYKTLTDEELRKVVQRISLEKQYKTLTATKSGSEKVADFMKKGGKVLVKGAAIAGVLGGAAALGKKYNLTQQQIENLDKTLQILKIIGSG